MSVVVCEKENDEFQKETDEAYMTDLHTFRPLKAIT